MNRQQNRPRNRDDFNKFNRNRPRNNDDRRRNDGNRGWSRNDQDGRMAQSRGGGGGGIGASGGIGGGGGGYGQINMGGYSQNMPLYGQQNQMPNYGGFGNDVSAFQQNRFGMSQQQRISPWANNMMPGMATSGDEAKLAMNILNAVLSSSGPGESGRGMSPPPNKMRRMDHREGGYDDRRRRPRSPSGGRSSHPNRQQSSQRFGTDRRGRDGHSSNQRNDDHRFRNSVNKNPGVARSSRQSSGRSSEVVQRKSHSFEEREKETKEYSDLPVKALKCRMCDKSEFHNVAAYLAHVHSKGHAKVAKAYYDKITALTTLLKQNAKLALHKELIKMKASGKKADEKECRVCDAPMVYGNLKHKNILACKILHKFTNQTLCCGKDHKHRNVVEEHCLTLAHLKAKYESECQSEEKETKQEEPAEDEDEKISRQKRDEARRKRKFGDNETDEEEEDEEEEENEENKERDTEVTNDNEKQEGDNVMEENQDNQVEDVEKMEMNEEDDAKTLDNEKDKIESSSIVAEETETSQDEKKDEERTEEENSNNQVDNKDQKQQQNDKESNERRQGNGDDRRGKINRNRNNKKSIDQAKIIQQMSLQELLEYHKKFLVDDPEKLGPYDPANPIGLNYIETHAAFHCMACIEYYPAALDDLMSHCCSKEHYKMFRNKYMKLQGVRDSPTSLSRLKAAREKEIKKESERSQERDTKDEDNKQGDEKNKDGEEEEVEDQKDGVAGDDALYDPYEGESGDLTTLLQDKKCDGDPDSQVPEGFEIKDEVHGSEPEVYEDNILDYDEDVGEDIKDDDENERQEEDKRSEADAYDENDEYRDEENAEFHENDEHQGDDNERYQDDKKDDYDEVEEEKQEVGDDDDDDDDKDDEETPAPTTPARRARSKRVFF